MGPHSAITKRGFGPDGTPVYEFDLCHGHGTRYRTWAAECPADAIHPPGSGTANRNTGGPSMRQFTVGTLMTPADLVVTVRPDTPFKAVAALLSGHRISGVPVLGRSGKVLGVVSEADLLPKEIRANGPVAGRHPNDPAEADFRRRAAALTALDLMTAPAVTASPKEVAAAAAARMERYRIRRLPVVNEHGHLQGIISRRDVLRAYLRRDEEIDAEVRAVLADELGHTPETCRTSVRDGVVTLCGQVPTRSTAQLVRAAVARVEGVVGLDYGLTFDLDDQRG